MGCTLGSCVVLVVSYPHPFPRIEHECTVGIDPDPPVRCSHSGRMTRTQERQLLRACLRFARGVAHVDTSWSCGALLSDSTFVIHDFMFAESSNSFTFSLYEILSTPCPQYRPTRIARFTIRESASPFASSVDNSSWGVRSHLSSVRSLLTPSETCLSISPVQSFTLLDDPCPSHHRL